MKEVVDIQQATFLQHISNKTIHWPYYLMIVQSILFQDALQDFIMIKKILHVYNVMFHVTHVQPSSIVQHVLKVIYTQEVVYVIDQLS